MIPLNRVLGYITDAANVMKSSASVLQSYVDFESLLHMTCCAHGIHNVAEEARNQFKKADNVIMRTKAIFTKAPKRRKILKMACPTMKAPPAPVITRWGTWLEAIRSFYSDKENRTMLAHGISQIRDSEILPEKQLELLELQQKKVEKETKLLQLQLSQQLEQREQEQLQKTQESLEQKQKNLKHQLQMLDRQKQLDELKELSQNQQHKRNKRKKSTASRANNEADSEECNKIESWEKQYALLWYYDELVLWLNQTDVIEEFEFVNEHLSSLVFDIKKLETEILEAHEGCKILDQIGAKLRSTPGMPVAIIKKFDDVFAKNSGYVALSTYFKSNKTVKLSPLDKWSDEQLKLLKFFPLSTAQVERIFSIYKIMLRSNRRRFKFRNFKKFVIAKCILQQVI